MKSRPLAFRVIVVAFLIVVVGPLADPIRRRSDELRFPPSIASGRAAALLSTREVVRVHVEYDTDFARDRGTDAGEFIAEALGIVNLEWQRYRSEWFELAALELQPATEPLDASYVLGSFLLATKAEPSTIHVRIVGRQLEVYSNGRGPTAVGGLAFRGSDVLVLSAPASVTVELLAYYLFHEIGHLWEAFDLPFAGGETTFGDKNRYTFEVDAGNAEILEGSSGPSARNTPNLAPAILASRFRAARKLTSDPSLLARIDDLLLHEPVEQNPEWMRKKDALLAGIRDERIIRFIREQETTPPERRAETELRRKLATHYWKANEALQRGDAVRAELELEEMILLQEAEANENIRILVGAVERKIRRHAR